MITPALIQVLFWVGSILSIIAGIVVIVAGSSSRDYGDTGTWSTLLGLAYIFLGPLLVRLWCELLILFFRMNETLTDISNKLGQRNP
jgi:hypothetical protein